MAGEERGGGAPAAAAGAPRRQSCGPTSPKISSARSMSLTRIAEKRKAWMTVPGCLTRILWLWRILCLVEGCRTMSSTVCRSACESLTCLWG